MLTLLGAWSEEHRSFLYDFVGVLCSHNLNSAPDDGTREPPQMLERFTVVGQLDRPDRRSGTIVNNLL